MPSERVRRVQNAPPCTLPTCCCAAPTLSHSSSALTSLPSLRCAVAPSARGQQPRLAAPCEEADAGAASGAQAPCPLSRFGSHAWAARRARAGRSNPCPSSCKGPPSAYLRRPSRGSTTCSSSSRASSHSRRRSGAAACGRLRAQDSPGTWSAQVTRGQRCAAPVPIRTSAIPIASIWDRHFWRLRAPLTAYIPVLAQQRRSESACAFRTALASSENALLGARTSVTHRVRGARASAGRTCRAAIVPSPITTRTATLATRHPTLMLRHGSRPHRSSRDRHEGA